MSTVWTVAKLSLQYNLYPPSVNIPSIHLDKLCGQAGVIVEAGSSVGTLEVVLTRNPIRSLVRCPLPEGKGGKCSCQYMLRGCIYLLDCHSMAKQVATLFHDDNISVSAQDALVSRIVPTQWTQQVCYLAVNVNGNVGALQDISITPIIFPSHHTPLVFSMGREDTITLIYRWILIVSNSWVD